MNRWQSHRNGSPEKRAFIGTPVAEFRPTRMARDAIALIGDAAHVISPVTGAGFHNALLDVKTLASAVPQSLALFLPQAQHAPTPKAAVAAD